MRIVLQGPSLCDGPLLTSPAVGPALVSRIFQTGSAETGLVLSGGAAVVAEVGECAAQFAAHLYAEKETDVQRAPR